MQLYILSVDLYIDHEFADTENVGVFDTLEDAESAKVEYQNLQGSSVEFNPIEVVDLNKVVLPQKHRFIGK